MSNQNVSGTSVTSVRQSEFSDDPAISQRFLLFRKPAIRIAQPKNKGQLT
jgi:hypothetical protein